MRFLLLFVGCSDGTTALVHHIPGLQLAFHVATLMPNDGRRCSNKKRHIGNNYVTISYLEEGGKRTERVWRGEVAVPYFHRLLTTGVCLVMHTQQQHHSHNDAEHISWAV